MDGFLISLTIIVVSVYIIELVFWQIWNEWYYRTGILIFSKRLLETADVKTFIEKMNPDLNQIRFHKCPNKILLRPRPPFTDIGYTRWIITFCKESVNIQCRVSYFLPILYCAFLIYTFHLIFLKETNLEFMLSVTYFVILCISILFIALILYERKLVLNALQNALEPN